MESINHEGLLDSLIGLLANINELPHKEKQLEIYKNLSVDLQYMEDLEVVIKYWDAKVAIK